MNTYLHFVPVLLFVVEGLVVVVVDNLHRLLRIGRHLVTRGAEMRDGVKVRVCNAEGEKFGPNLIQKRMICMLGTQIRGVRAALAFITYI